jgi:hypothetical protein
MSHICHGGLAGFPCFGGVTSFDAMVHHIPDGGPWLVVCGPHVGVDSMGQYSEPEKSCQCGGCCCGSVQLFLRWARSGRVLWFQWWTEVPFL